MAPQWIKYCQNIGNTFITNKKEKALAFTSPLQTLRKDSASALQFDPSPARAAIQIDQPIE
jgi:hypothetical protein